MFILYKIYVYISISIYEYIHSVLLIVFMVSICYIPLSNMDKIVSLLLSNIKWYRVLTKVYYTSAFIYSIYDDVLLRPEYWQVSKTDWTLPLGLLKYSFETLVENARGDLRSREEKSAPSLSLNLSISKPHPSSLCSIVLFISNPNTFFYLHFSFFL